MQSQIQYSEEGIFIPSEWLKDMGTDVSVQKSGDVIIIETKQREAARNRLQKMVRQLRQTARELKPITEDEVANLVNEVREYRASNH